MTVNFRRLFCFLAIVGLYAGSAQAQSPADFYKGKTITFIVSSGAGGGYDRWARTLAIYLPKHIPGHPDVVVKNMAGAGGIKAGDYLYSVAAKDGTVIGGLQNNVPFEPLWGTKQATFDTTKFNWLGTPSVETSILTVWYTSPVNTWEDVKKTEITVGSSGAHSTPSFYGHLLNDVLGLKLKIIVGYKSQTQAFLAMERGEINGFPSVFYSSLKATRPDWIRDKKVKLLVQMGQRKDPELPNVPYMLDLIKNPADKAVAEAAFGPLGTGRPYLLPPGVPADRVAAMRKAFTDTFNDPQFRADAHKHGLDVDAPRSGEELQAYIQKIYNNTPPNLVARLRKY
jgi:tripartite-type tricarboxylate transporter receptor subunit TctC